MIERDLDLILKENFDTSDRRTRRILLNLSEADQNLAMANLAAKLYNKIVDKVDDIDFGTIPASKGDITKIGNYMEMMECIKIIYDILAHYKQPTTQIDILSEAVENLKSSKAIWEKAFAVKSEIPITFYNTIALSIVSGVSLLISSSIDFIKEPDNNSYTVSFDRVSYMKTKDKLLFTNLDKFNKSYKKGDIKKLMDSLNKSVVKVGEAYENQKNIGGTLEESEYTSAMSIDEIGVMATLATGVFTAVTLGILITLVIPILHELTALLYCAKQSVSEYFEIQSKIVQFNAENLKYNYTKSEKEIEKIYKKQTKIADLFKKISNAFAVKMNKSEKEAIKKIEQERKEKYKVDDLDNVDIPEFTGSSIF